MADALIICEDWIAIPAKDWRAMAILHHRAREQSLWEEVVAGETLLTLRFDPDHIDPDTARNEAHKLLRKNDSDAPLSAQQHHILSLVINKDTAPDRVMVAETLNIPPKQLPQWLAQRRYTVSLTGFQPGFAYLADDDHLPEIPRLDTPRLAIPAGSFGFRGGKACLYAHQGPGGWPIIGRTSTPLFQPENSEAPALLALGDTVSFDIVERDNG